MACTKTSQTGTKLFGTVCHADASLLVIDDPDCGQRAPVKQELLTANDSVKGKGQRPKVSKRCKKSVLVLSK